MLFGCSMIALRVMLCGFMVRFGGVLVVLGCFLVCVVCHGSSFPVRRPSHLCDDATLHPDRLLYGSKTSS
jgi:hypothetical protein